MAVIRRPTVQAYPTKYVQKPSAYWQSRGLVLSFLGNRLVYSRDTPIIPTLTATGTPKRQSGPNGDAIGFGTTYGTGATDMLTGGVLPVTVTKARSIFTSLFLNTYGGGGFGRIFQNTTGTALNAGESLYPSATTITYNNYITAGGQAASWVFPVAPATGRWTSIGISIADISGQPNTGVCYLDGALATTFLQGGLAGGMGSNVPTNLTWGNRTTSGDRGLDGMLSITHFFDTDLSAEDQERLDANPNCVWSVPNVRRTISTGGLTLTPGLFTNTNSFFAPTVTPGTTSLTPGLFTNTNQFYAAVVSLGSSQTLVPSLLTNTNDFFSPTVTPGSVSLAPSLFTNTNSFFAPTVYAPVEFHDDHERSNINIAASSIVQDSYAPTIAIYPRLQLSDSFGRVAYEFFHLRVTGVLGKRPNFKVRYWTTPGVDALDAWGVQLSQRCMYSYDQVTWNYFDTHAASGDNLNIDFKLNADFTGDTVYVASQRPFTGTMVGAMVASLASTYTSYVSMPTSSAGNAYVADTISTQTDERGRVIPAQPIYSMRITDDSQQPDDGSPKRIVVLIAGQHSSEDVGNWMVRGAIEFLCGADAKAVAARKNFEFFVYPHANPMGRYGGHWRGDFNSAHPTYDGNRRWLASPAMEYVTKHITAITEDLAGRKIAGLLDYHGGYSGYFMYSGSPLWDEFHTKMLTYTAGITIYGDNPVNSASYYAVNSYGADLATVIESSRDQVLTEAQILAYGATSIKSLSDLFTDGVWPVLLPARLDNTNTFFAPTVALASSPQTLAPELFINTSSFFTPTVAPGTVTLTPSLFTNDNTFFDCVVLQDGDQILSPSLFTNDNAFFSLVVNGGQTTYAGEIDLTPSKWYIKRNKKILLFNNAQEADAFIEAEEAAEQAIHEAQKTSRRARKRLRDKIITVEPAQTVDVDQLAQAVERFSIPVDLPKLLAQQDYERVMQIMAMAMEMQDEEDIELLLLA